MVERWECGCGRDNLTKRDRCINCGTRRGEPATMPDRGPTGPEIFWPRLQQVNEKLFALGYPTLEAVYVDGLADLTPAAALEALLGIEEDWLLWCERERRSRN